MAKLDRKTQKIFAANAQQSQVTAFRTAGGTPYYTKDVDQIQNANFQTGWLEENNVGNVIPYAEDMNGVFYSFSRNLAYLYQQGIPEWINTETYYTNAMCMYNGVLYQSLVDNNLNKNPSTETAYWQPYASPVSGSVTGAENLGTGSGISTGVLNSKIQLKSLVAGSNVTLTEAADSITIESTAGGGTGSIAWGNITGSIANQSDLATALSQRGTLSGTNSWTGTNTFSTILPSSINSTLGNSSNYWTIYSPYVYSDEATSFVFEDSRFENSRFKVGWNGSSLGIFPEMSSTDGYDSYLGDTVFRWDYGYFDNLNSNYFTTPEFKIDENSGLTISSKSGGSVVTAAMADYDATSRGLALYPPDDSRGTLGYRTNMWANLYASAVECNDLNTHYALSATDNYLNFNYADSISSFVNWMKVGMVSSTIGLFPLVTAQLGTSTDPWSKGYFTDIYSTNGQITNLTPSTNGSGKVGSSGAHYSEGYINTITTGTINPSTSNTAINIGQSLIPSSNSSYSLGNSTHAFKQLNVDPNDTTKSFLQIGGSGTLQLFFNYKSGRTPTYALYPASNNNVALGTADIKWSKVYSQGGVDTSDRDQKENIQQLEIGLDILNKLPIYSFTWKNAEPDYVAYGTIAQEALEIAPELVEVPKGYKEGDGTLGLYTNNVLFLAVRAIQELSAKVDSLEQQLREIQR